MTSFASLKPLAMESRNKSIAKIKEYIPHLSPPDPYSFRLLQNFKALHPNPSYNLLNLHKEEKLLQKFCKFIAGLHLLHADDAFLLQLVRLEEVQSGVLHLFAFDVAFSELCYAGGTVFIWQVLDPLSLGSSLLRVVLCWLHCLHMVGSKSSDFRQQSSICDVSLGNHLHSRLSSYLARISEWF